MPAFAVFGVVGIATASLGDTHRPAAAPPRPEAEAHRLDCATLLAMTSGDPIANHDAYAMLFGHLHGLSPSVVSQQMKAPGGEKVLGIPDTAVAALVEFPAVLEPLLLEPAHGGGAPIPSLLDGAAKVRDSARARRLYGSLLRASAMDGWFAPFEGQKRPRFDALDSNKPLRDQLAAKAAEQRQGARATPFGTHTDDTQFWMAGVMTASRTVPELLATWREFGQQQIWRNGGSRTAAFLAGNDHAFRGDVGAGDFLRGLSVFMLDPGAWRKNWADAALRLNLTPEQNRAVLLFLESYEAHLDGDPNRAPLSRLTAEGVLPGRMRALFATLDRSVVRDGDWRAYVGGFEKIGTDYDTYAFLGGLFASDKTLPLAPLEAGPSFVRTYAAAAAFRAAGLRVTVPTDFRWQSINAERERNEALALLRSGRSAPPSSFSQP